MRTTVCLTRSKSGELTVKTSQAGNRYVIGTVVDVQGLSPRMTEATIGTSVRIMLTQGGTVHMVGKQTVEAAILKLAKNEKFINVTLECERITPPDLVDAIGGIINPKVTSIDKGTPFIDEEVEAARFMVAKESKRARTLQYHAQTSASRASQGDDDVHESIVSGLIGALSGVFGRR